jgi:hypothetical protein
VPREVRADDRVAAVRADLHVERRLGRGVQAGPDDLAQPLGRLAGAGQRRLRVAEHLDGEGRAADPGPQEAHGPRREDLGRARLGRGLPGLVGVRDVGRDRREVEHDLGDVDARDPVDHRVVGLRDQREAAVLEALDHPHLPQRPRTVELLGEDPAGQAQELALGARARQRGLADVVLEVERRIVDPQRAAAARGRDLELLAVARHEVQAHPQRVEELVERRRRALEAGQSADVHVRIGALLVQERRVDRGEAVEVLLRHGASLASGLP